LIQEDMDFTTPHAYDAFLGPNDPLAEQPERIIVNMKPHQRAALHKAMCMERYGRVSYNMRNPTETLFDPYGHRRPMFEGPMSVESNIGIMGDMVGYGKTLTALAIIAATPVQRIHRKPNDVYSYLGRGYAHFTAICEHRDIIDEPLYIRTTLVVVPRGPVFVQWERAIQTQTTLCVLAIDSLSGIRKNLPPAGTDAAVIRAFFEQYDVVLVKATAFKILMDYYQRPYQEQHPIQAWDRIMMDEAHDIVCKVPLYSFRFLWLISATYKTLLSRAYGGRSMMSFAIRDILDEERMNLLLLKGSTAFVTQSFHVPPMIERFYLCAMSRNLSAIHSFLTPAVQERINANDIQGAIRELGGHNETEDDIVRLVTREIERDIRNKEHELAYVQGLDIEQDARNTRTTSIQTELTRLRDRQQNLIDRITALSTKTCPICYDNYTNPIMLPCTHVFCGTCLMKWMRNGHVCPECRAPIQARGLVSIVQDRSQVVDEPAIDRNTVLSKEDTLLKVMRENPNGKFLIFSRCDHTFWHLVERLSMEGITFGEMKGSTATMMNMLQRFREGAVRVIMLNTHHAGSGIDISCATDVILFHRLGEDGVQAIGRAQRVGRTSPLKVHHLCYPQELY
jgi:SNF2 family DNA or RNA helicase